ncbi:MAG: beta-ketoacyl-[acyl-carrier-protein] synthase family protein [Planctomycetes bacterium]|nr:beta-ketoacyl-[acyl-carrier-protein] synthase family protein [Planctomycetota bacterium]
MKPSTAVITGLGCVSPYGVGVEPFWEKLCAGEQAFREITVFDASPFRNTLAGEVADFPVPEGMSRCCAFLVKAVEEAIIQARLIDPETKASDSHAPEPARIGVIIGSNFGGAQSGLAALAAGKEPGKGSCDLSASSMGAGLAAIREIIACSGPASVISLACASGTAVLGIALSWIRQGRADLVIAGGFDELSEHCYAGLSGLRAITKEMIRPFHAQRSGTLFSEGAGVLVVETQQSARSRGAVPLARLLGRGMNNDAFHMTAPDKSGTGIAAVMAMALADAEVRPEEIVHINCHATGTKYNDAIETTAIKKIFGDHASKMVCTANKSCFGHAMGAAGALEAISTVKSILHGVIPPTVGLDEPDPALDLDYCAEKARKMPVSMAINNSFGLGGINASVVLAKA